MKATFSALLLVGAVTDAAYAQSTNQFDLICAGSATPSVTMESPEFPYDKSPRPVSFRLRVDLEARQFCQDQCQTVEAIRLVSPINVIFRTNPLPRQNQLIVSRTDGTFSLEWNEPGDGAVHRPMIFVHGKGQCTKSDFTPIPKTLF